MRKVLKNGTSFRKQQMKILLLITIPLSALLIINNLYSVNVFNGKIAESNQRVIEFCINQIHRELTAVDETLSGIVAGNTDFIRLSDGADPLQAHLSSLALFNQMKALMPAYPSVGAFFVYSVPSGAERDLFMTGDSYAEKQKIRAFVRSAVADNRITYQMKWKYAEVDGSYYLFRFFGGRSTYIAAMVPLEHLLDIEDWQMEEKAVSVFTTLEAEPLTQQELIKTNRIDLDGDYETYFISGEQEHFMVIGRDIENTDCRLVFLVGGSGYLDSLNPIQIMLLLISFLTVLLIPVFISWINRKIIAPLKEITNTMTQIQKGDLEAQVSTIGQVQEFRQMGETFNSMMVQIKDLRIASYEHEIETQKAQLRYLQLQIRPHFFLNCLKSIYAFAQQKQYKKLQKMILAFSRHVRYIFKDNMEFVPLERELNHVKNYMEIQAISAVHPPVCKINAEKALLELPIPPLLVQTFVENSVKHETSPDRALELEVDVKLLKTDSGEFANIIVSDNGNGFSEAVLEEINQLEGSVYAHHHVGLNNVKRRLRLIYGADIQFAFYNNDRGSVSDIIIPVKKREDRDSGEGEKIQ